MDFLIALGVVLSPLFIGSIIIAGVRFLQRTDADPNRNRYETILKSLDGFADDWKIEKKKGGRRYSLHENIIIVRPNEGVIQISVYDPNDPKDRSDYRPNWGYQDVFKQALNNLAEYQELRKLVKVATDAVGRLKPEAVLEAAKEAARDFEERQDRAKATVEELEAGAVEREMSSWPTAAG